MISFCSKKNTVGINISDYSIKVVEVKCVGGKYEVISSGMVLMEPGIVTNGRIENSENLKKYIDKVLAEASPRPIEPKDIAFAIPERQVYSHVFEIDASSQKDINKIVYDEALSCIPINREELVFSYKVLEKFKAPAEVEDVTEKKEVVLVDKIRILIVGVQNEVVEEWKLFFNAMNVDIGNFFTETFSTYQGMFETMLDHAVCLVDIGASTTNVSIVSPNGLMYSSTINAAGNYFSKKLKDGIGKKADGTESGYSHEEVGQLKREVGLLPSEKLVNVAVILKSAMLPIVEEIRTAIKYYNLKTGKVLTDIILIGGSSKLKGLSEYLTSNLSGLKYELVARTATGEEDKAANKDIKAVIGWSLRNDMAIEYTEAIGLAMGKNNKVWSKLSPVIPLAFKANEYALPENEEKEEEISDDESASGDDVETTDKLSWIKEHKQLVQLLVLVIIGSALIGWAFWYRDQSAKKALQELEARKTYDKVIIVKAPVAIGQSKYDTESVKGRIFKDIVKESLPADKLIAKSNEFAIKQLKPGEKVWKNNLNIIDPEKIVFPVTMEWLVYNEKDVIAKFMADARKQHNDDKDFGFRNTEVQNLEIDGDKYYLTGVVNITTKIKPTGVATSTLPMVKKDDKAVSQVSTPISTSTPNEPQNNTPETPVSTVSSSTEQTSAMPSDTATSTAPAEANSIQALSALFANSKKKFVSIDGSGMLSLNVRSASSTSASILTKIYPKNVYELVEDDGEWLLIKANETQEGWVSGTYAKILE